MGTFGTAICKECGFAFEKMNPKAKYCSIECAGVAATRRYEMRTEAARRAWEKYGKHLCHWCGKEFEPKVKRQVYCCPECGYNAKKETNVRFKYRMKKGEVVRQERRKKEQKPKKPAPKKDGFSWAQVLECMRENRCQYARALEILEQERQKRLLASVGDAS